MQTQHFGILQSNLRPQFCTVLQFSSTVILVYTLRINLDYLERVSMPN